MTAKHTPGPWRVSTDNGDFTTQTDDGKGLTLTHLSGKVYLHERNGRANARLIAAAPEMYQLLKWWVFIFQKDALAFQMIPDTQALLARIDGQAETGPNLSGPTDEPHEGPRP